MRFITKRKGRAKLEAFDAILLSLESGDCIKYWKYAENWPDESVRGLVDYRIGFFESTEIYPESSGR